MNSPFMNYFQTGLTNRGFLTVKFNFAYMEQKRKIPDPQPRLQARYRTVISDVLAKHHPRNLIIGGKSMGGRVASYIAGDIPAVRGLIFLGYPLHPPGKQDQLRDAHLYALDRPMLFVSGTRDTFAERPLLQSVADRIGDRATLVWIEGGDHSLKTSKTGKQSLQTAADAIEDWARKLERPVSF